MRKRLLTALLAGGIVLGTVAGSLSAAYASDTVTESSVEATEAASEVSVEAATEEGNKADSTAVPDDITPVEILLHIDVAPKVKTGTVYITSRDSGTEYTAAIVNGQAGVPLMPGTYSVTRIEDSNGNPVKDITDNTISASHQIFATSQYSITNAKADDPAYQFVTSQVDFFLNHVVMFIVAIALAIALYRIQKKKETIGKKD